MKQEYHVKQSQLLKLFRQKYGNGEIDNVKLNTISKKYIGRGFKGVYAWDTLPSLKNNNYAIINTDSSDKSGTHWVGVYSKNNEYYIFDSFGRHAKNILKPFYAQQIASGRKMIDVNLSTDQHDKQSDCGLRSMTALLMAKYLGIKNIID